MKAVFYLSKYNTISDAVILYLKIINKSLTGREDFNPTDSLKQLKGADLIVTYFVKDYFVARSLHPKTKIINWFQGVLPEESLMWQKSQIRYYLYSFMEWFALKSSDYNFFVSEAMLLHYKRKYRYKGKNYYVMPCFNADIKSSFNSQRKLSFIYIGSLSAWQCIEETLLTFKEVNKELPESTLTILSSEKEKALKIIEATKIKNVKVDYIPLEMIADYLSDYKYGFLIRKNILVNRVSTPNKLNTYMASGVIPIYSDVIESFKKSLFNVKYKIPLQETEDIKKAAAQIINFERNVTIEYDRMRDNYVKVFEGFYNKENYSREINEVLKKDDII